MQISLPRSLQRFWQPSAHGRARLDWTRAEPAPGPEQTLVTLLRERGPLPRQELVAQLAAEILRAARSQPQAALVDIGVWGRTLAQAEAERVVENSLGRLLTISA